MASMDIISTIFMVIGALVVLLYLYIIISNKIKSHYTNLKRHETPPSQYMNEVGLKCPNMWEYKGLSPNGNNYICKNYLDIPVKDNSSSTGCPLNCYTNMENKEAEFSVINQNWATLSDNQRKQAVKDRCNWLKCCGPSPNGNYQTDAVWLGVDKYC